MSYAATFPLITAESGLASYLKRIREFPILEPQEEYMLAKSWREHGDLGAAHRLVTSHLRLAAKLAAGYRGNGLPTSEVISEGNVGLMRRSSVSNPTRGSGLPPMRCGGSRPRSRNTSCAPGRW
jgi:RNA polymerase sigma-32 factor